MKVRIRLSKLAAALLIAWMQIYAQEVQAGEERPDWWQAQRDMVAILMGQGTDIAELVAKVNISKPKTSQEAMFKLSVLLHAGINQEAIETLRELKELRPNLDNCQIESIYHEASDHLSAWEVAQAVVETFPDNISEIGLDRLLEHFLESGWTVEKVDQWLGNMPAGGDHFWAKQRLRFNMTHGRGEPLVQALLDDVRRNPQDIDGTIVFLDALCWERYAGHDKRDLSWMTEIVKPNLATEAEGIALRLWSLSNFTAALTFYQQAIEIPLTEKDLQRFRMMCQGPVLDETLRAMYAVHTREELARCLLQLGRNDEAQKWMVEAADIREKHHLGRNAQFAGQVQGASGQRVIEGRIQEEEKKSENDPAYWQERAQYYCGRKETAQEEEALKKGLALTTPQPEPGSLSKGSVGWRCSLLADYACFLARVNRTEEAVALLRKEMEQAPATSESARRAAYLLADFEKQVRVEDGVLWNWLANQPKWDSTEERLLWWMLRNAKWEDLNKHFSRAEKLAKGKDPSRAYTLGWIMNRMQFPQRAIPLLKYAVEKATDKDLKEKAVLALLESYLDTGDWKSAEEVFPDASNQFELWWELSRWYSRLAIVAAQAGARADALRIWKAVANVNPAEMGGLYDLVKAGLRDELTAFYREMQKKMPSSEIPARALKALEEK